MKYCPVNKKCGGCSYLDVNYHDQLQQKKEYIQHLFPKHHVNDVLGMDDPYHYRHKVYATFSHTKDGKIKCGMYEENTHKVIPTQSCLIQHTQANLILQTICEIATELHIESYDEDSYRGVLRHAYIRVSHATSDVLLVLVIGSKDLPSSSIFVKKLIQRHPNIQTIILNQNRENTSMILGRKSHVLYGKGYIEDNILDTTFQISTNTFYQVNPLQTEVIYQTAINMAHLKKSDTVLDMCCGIGTISLIVAKKVRYVLGVEINPQSIKDAIKNAKRNHIDNAEFIAEDSEQFIKLLGDSPDVIFLDPPRSGFTETFMKRLNTLKSDRIVYVSCNPQTQARDLKLLTNYKIVEIQPVDNFPMTRHVENVVLMSRIK